MNRSRRFDGRVVLVTGSTGMAASAAHALAIEGARVFVISRTADHARALADELVAGGAEAGWAAADLSVEADVDAAVSALVARFGRLDACYSIAGISGRKYGDGPLDQATFEGWQTVVGANATSQFLVARACVRRFLAQAPHEDGSRGVLLLMSSTLATDPVPSYFATHAYAASKGAIDALARTTAAYYAPDGIRINAIAPSLIATPMSRRAQGDPAILAYLRLKQPLADGPIEADAVTDAALFLLSDDARMVTGQVLRVDGGWSVSEPR